MPKILISSATIEDARMLFEWRNDALTRQMFFNSDAVVWDDHLAWLNAALNNPQRLILIGRVDGEPVGTVRFDMENARASVSVTINPKARGRGLSSPLLLAAQTYLPAHIHNLSAEIKLSNPTSIKAFQGAGYSVKITGDTVVTYEKKIEGRP